MDNYSSNLIGFIKAATSQTPSVPGASPIPANPLPGYNNANAARQRRQQYAQQQQASASQHGAALRAHEKAQAQAAKAQEAYLNQSRAYRSAQNEPLVQEIRGQVPKVKLKNTSGIFTQRDTTRLHPHGHAIVGAISDYKLLNNGTLPTQEQAYGMADKAIENANKQNKLLRDHYWQLEEGEEKKIKDHVNDIIYKLYQPQPWGGRYVDEVVRNNTNPQGYPIA